ncbi:hypothetical protein [Gilvibacter sp. SZ-19]|jgi:hypothetical protein|uniref:hypothetical protein n=1 Tax=unclassified Gilvibacter TaxID=2625242 RepID=UPI000B3C9B09|nr:hypothetical protein [Gilvibacter sp. SZ-19]ARV11755.1 hypothetical protein BTO09_05085 [Gilvibacter sp. SZ-19]
MKKIYSLLVFAFVLVMASCSNDANDSYENSPDVQFTITERTTDDIDGKDEVVTCAATELIAGQNYVAGEILVTADESTVYITYRTYDGWVIDATHLFAGVCEDIPQNRAGNPKIGVFDHATSHSASVDEVTYALDIEFFEQCFCVAAHAEVSLLNEAGTVIQSETAWGSGTTFDGNSWAMYSDFCLDGCTENNDGPADDPTR